MLVGWWSRGVRTAAANATRGAALQIAAAVHRWCTWSLLSTLKLSDITCIPSSRHCVSVSWAIGPRERAWKELKNSRRASREEPAPVGMGQTKDRPFEALVNDERDGTWKRSLCGL
jgi:hypothetical protein